MYYLTQKCIFISFNIVNIALTQVCKFNKNAKRRIIKEMYLVIKNNNKCKKYVYGSKAMSY